jgi:putative NADPH-quinone reductase
MLDVAKTLKDITFVDLLSEYPRHNINVDREQERLIEHDVILFQFPLFWYSTPSIIKEWQDLVLQHGFAYGSDGTALKGKTMMLALTAAGPVEAYSTEGFQHFPLRTFLSPLEQTARLCHMTFPAPYVLHSSLKAQSDGSIAPHAEGYGRLLTAIRDDAYDFAATMDKAIVTPADLPIQGA